MNLSDEQKTAVTEWVTAGAELGEIQNRLKEEFDVSLTYLDTRFLLGDLGLELLSEREEEEEPEESSDAKDSAPEAEAPDSTVDAAPPEAPASEEEPAPGGGVSVTVDTIAQPHAIVSGRVTFSDGKSAAWSLDQMGRLSLDPTDPDHKPSEADIASFQMELQNVLRQQGL